MTISASRADPHDLIYFDEGTDFLFSQYRLIIGWNRSSVASQRCRVVVGSNPGTTSEGLWVIKHWAPWLDPLHPRPAQPGELCWFTTGPDGEDAEVDGRGPHLVGGEQVLARSGTYLPARLSDNPDLAETGYGAVLAGLPPELCAAYRDGNFGAGLQDHEFQVNSLDRGGAGALAILAPGVSGHDRHGVDIAQGGSDRTVIAARYGGWNAPLVRKPGKECRAGTEVVALIVQGRRNNCPVVIDMGGGWGTEGRWGR